MLQTWAEQRLVQSIAEPLSWAVLVIYYAALFALALFGLYRFWLWRKSRTTTTGSLSSPGQLSDNSLPEVVVQLPVYNERYVAERLVNAVCLLDYPRDRLHVQVLDDSTDDTRHQLAGLIDAWRARGVRIDHLTRPHRVGFKAGALDEGLKKSTAPLIAIFDADFVPPTDFLLRAVPHFSQPAVGMVQAQWDYLNRDQSVLTRAQAVLLDAHFLVEQPGRAAAGLWFNFNGTAGIWRRQAIDDAGGWMHDTLTEDLDLSYRAQLAGWKFVYCAELGVASELPTLMSGLKSQQARWATGGAQTMRKLWRSMMRHEQRQRRQRLHGWIHLVSPLGHLSLLTIALLYLPSLLVRQRLGLSGLFWLDQLLLVAGTGSFTWVFTDAVRRRGIFSAGRVTDLVAAMVLGLGLAVANSRAVITGLLAMGGDFHRTPKYAETLSVNQWSVTTPRYRTAVDHTWFYEAAMAAYSVLALCMGVLMHWWSSLPFLAMFAVGYVVVFLQTFDARLPPRQLPTRAPRPTNHYILE